MLPFYSQAVATATAQPATPAPPQPTTSTATPATVAPTRQVISANDKAKIGRLFGSINRIQYTVASNQEAATQKRNTPYTEAKFEEVWYKFIQHIPQQPDLHFLFNKVPNQKEGALQITVDNKVVYNKLISIKSQLLTYLSNQLQNDHFSLNVQLNEQSQKPTTQREKARAMNESNGNLMKLFTSWGLRLN